MSIEKQTYKDYEIVITENGKMAENTNSAIKKAKGDIIKILFMDDYFNHENALKNIVENFKGGWLVTGCVHNGGGENYNPHLPSYNDMIHTGQNTIGSPSVLSFENNEPLLFDEEMSWLLDCDLYKRLYERYGEPTILNDLNVTIGVGDHQMTHLLTEEEKLSEHYYLNEKYK